MTNGYKVEIDERKGNTKKVESRLGQLPVSFSPVTGSFSHSLT
jgi:hypothetical protein